MTRHITQFEVEENSNALPAFPRVIADLMQTLDDPDANLKVMVEHISRDPVVAGRVFARANTVQYQTRSRNKIEDLQAAAALIGMAGLRETIMMVSMAGFFPDDTAARVSPAFWRHSIVTGVCAKHLAEHVGAPSQVALLAGLLHDVGQLWLHRFVPDEFALVRTIALQNGMGIDAAERNSLGVDHTTIGAWLTKSWGLPEAITLAIKHHHAPDSALHEPLVPILHMAEVISNALNLNDGDMNRINYVSAHACEALKLNWEDPSSHGLLARIEAISHHMMAYYQPIKS